MTHSQLEAMLAETHLDAEDADRLGGLLRPLVELAQERPVPSSELLALFGEQTSTATARERLPRPMSTRRGGRRHGVVAGAVVLALSGVGATGLSAAANTLPAPWQHQVSAFSRRYLPFDFPQPTVRIPHLAVTPRAGKALTRGARLRQVEQRARNAEEPTRSLARPRRPVRGAPSSMDTRHRFSPREDEKAAHSPPRDPSPFREAPRPSKETGKKREPGRGPTSKPGVSVPVTPVDALARPPRGPHLILPPTLDKPGAKDPPPVVGPDDPSDGLAGEPIGDAGQGGVGTVGDAGPEQDDPVHEPS